VEKLMALPAQAAEVRVQFMPKPDIGVVVGVEILCR
jgi:hypothetical protein